MAFNLRSKSVPPRDRSKNSSRSPVINPTFKLTQDNYGGRFFNGSRVDSNAGKVTAAGEYYAIPALNPPKAHVLPDKPPTTTTASTYKGEPLMHSSMSNKPLMPYSPNSARSRILQPDPKTPKWNASSIKFDDGIFARKGRHYVTTNNVEYTGEGVDVRTNPGIRSEYTKWRRFFKEQ